MAVPSALLIFAYCTSFLVAFGRIMDPDQGSCLQDDRHKATPSPEPYLKECSLYRENACCSVENIEDLTAPPAGLHWDRCGSLSPVCEAFLKRVVCFYRCSPDAAHWPHPQHGSSLRAVPLCHSFCRDWYEACKTDLTCARDWTSDPRGLNCTGSCVPYLQMYQHGRDLCESLWGDAFMTVEDEIGDDGPSCSCLSLSATDREIIAALRARKENPDELDTTKHLQNRAECTQAVAAAPPQARRSNNMLRKRSVSIHDSEGSGSGFQDLSSA